MKTRKLEKIAVVHFGSAEHLIFALPTLAALKNRGPEIKIELFLPAENKEFADKAPYIDKVHLVDLGKVGALIDDSSNGTSIFERLRKEVLNNEAYRTVINLSFSVSAAACATAFDTKHHIGPRLSIDGDILLDDEWSQYVAAVVDKSILNPFHICDLYKYIVRIHAADEAEYHLNPEIEGEQLYPEVFEKIDGLRIGIEISDKWSAKNYSSLIVRILTAFPKAGIVLTGTLQDQAHAKNLLDLIEDRELRSRCFPLTGRTSLQELLSVCNSTHLYIGFSGLGTHLATVAGTFSMVLSHVDQKMFQEGPVGHGHIIIGDQNDLKDSIDVPYRIVADTVQFAIETNGSQIPDEEQWRTFFQSKEEEIPRNLRIFQAQRMEYQHRDGRSRIDQLYRVLHGYSASAQEVLLTFYRLIWQFDLNASEDIVDDIAIKYPDTFEALGNMVDILGNLHKTAGFGVNYARFVEHDLQRGNIEQAQQYSERLQEVDNLFFSLAKKFPAIKPLTNFYHIHQFQCRYENPVDVAQYARIAYERVQTHVVIMLDLLHDVVSKHKVTRNDKGEEQQPEHL